VVVVRAEGWVCKGREEAMEQFGGKDRELPFALNFVIVCCVTICYVRYLLKFFAALLCCLSASFSWI
jgi:hypothetical protein